MTNATIQTIGHRRGTTIGAPEVTSLDSIDPDEVLVPRTYATTRRQRRWIERRAAALGISLNEVMRGAVDAAMLAAPEEPA